MKQIFRDHVEMVKVLREAPRKEIIQSVAFLSTLGALFYFSILIFG